MKAMQTIFTISKIKGMKTILSAGLALLFWANLCAQPGGAAREKIDAYRIAFITERLSLTPQEAQVFWPVYNQYQAERKKIRENLILDRVEMNLKIDDMTEKEVSDMLDNMIAGKQAEVDLYKKYVVEFKKVIPVKKVAILIRAEQDFKNQLLERIQNGGGNRPGGGRPGGGKP